MQLFLEILSGMETVKTLIRLLLKEQSDLGPHCLYMPFCQKHWCTEFKDICRNKKENIWDWQKLVLIVGGVVLISSGL